MEANSPDADRLWREFRRSGAPRALGELYDLVAPELLRVALHSTRDVVEAEDVLQATFVAAIERACGFDEARRVMPWLVGILGNEARRARTERRRQVDPTRLEEKLDAAPGADAERRELLALLDNAVARLPEEFRPVLVLRVRHGLGATQIAAALGRPSGTVRSQMQRGLELLRRTLPAGLAGGLAVIGLAPTRGLAAIRGTLLERVAPPHASASLTGTIGGILAVNRIVIVAVAVISCGIWFAWRSLTSTAVEPSEPRGGAIMRVPARIEDSRASESADEASARQELPAAEEARALGPASADVVRTSLVVTALAPDGVTPVEGELVLVRPRGGSPQGDDALVGRTDRDGRARFDPLESGPAHVQLLRGQENSIWIRAGEENGAQLGVHAGFEVHGLVVTADGTPVPLARVWLSRRYSINLGYVVATADRRGEFVVPWVGADHHLCALASGFAPSALAKPRGRPDGRFEMRLVLEREAVALRGRVVDERGDPVAQAHVLFGDELPQQTTRDDDGSYSYGPPPLRARTAADGTFELDHVELATHCVQARAANFAPYAEVLAFDAPRRPLEIVLQREARVVGRDAEVGRGGDRDTAADADAVDRGDEWLLEPEERLERGRRHRLVRGGGLRVLPVGRELGDVGTRRERAVTRAAEPDHPHVGVGGERGHRRGDRLPHLEPDRVQLPRVSELEPRHVRGAADDVDAELAHAGPELWHTERAFTTTAGWGHMRRRCRTRAARSCRPGRGSSSSASSRSPTSTRTPRS